MFFQGSLNAHQPVIQILIANGVKFAKMECAQRMMKFTGHVMELLMNLKRHAKGSLKKMVRSQKYQLFEKFYDFDFCTRLLRVDFSHL